jgi:hypothetical protein
MKQILDRSWMTLGIFVPVVGMIIAGWHAAHGVNLALVNALMLLEMLVLGLAISKNPLGTLINERNLISLSRFQMVLWTVIVLGAFLTFALVRIKDSSVVDSLNIKRDRHLLALLGISTTSLISSPLLLSTKTKKEPEQAEVKKTAVLTGEELSLKDSCPC